MVALYRRDSKSPLTTRLLLALGVVALLFLVRGAAWWTGSAWLDRMSMIPAALIPLGALIVTEGILRRHAPRAVKIAVVVGGIGLGLGGVLAMEGFSTLYSLSLSLFQLAGLRCTWLLATRDHTTRWRPKIAVSGWPSGRGRNPFIVTVSGAHAGYPGGWAHWERFRHHRGRDRGRRRARGGKGFCRRR
jgi:hypothetical protein